jgi:Arabinose efflux permease
MNSKNDASAVKPFVRTPFSWLMYLLLATFCYVQVSPGAIVPYLHTELHLDYTLDSLHLSSLALGSIVAGLVGSFIGRYFHRRTIIWSGMLCMLVGLLLLAVAHVVFLTLFSFFLSGFGGSCALIFMQSALTDYYGDQRATAITEANTACSAASVLAPACLSGAVTLGIGWRSMLVVPFIAVGLLALFWFKVPIVDAFPNAAAKTASAVAKKSRREPFPLSYWLYWLAMVLMVGIEWGLVFWGSGYLMHVVGLERNLATLLMSLFFVAAILGRIIGARLTRYFSAELLLPFMLIFGVIGFLLFWLGPVPIVNVVGLFLAGLGIENLFPLSFSAAVNQIPEHADFASSFGALGTGVAIFLAPFLLGKVADMVGLRLALACLLLLFVVSFVVLILAYRLFAAHAHLHDIADAALLSQEPLV